MFSCEHIVKRKEAIAPMSSHYLSSEFIQQYNCDGATKESLLDIMNSFAMPHLICLTEESFVVYGMPTSSNPVGYCHLSMKGDQLICSSTNCKGYVSATYQEKNKKICMHCHILFCLQSCLTRPPIVTPLTPADAANLLTPSGPQIVTPATPANAANLVPPSQPPIITPPTPTDFANLLPPSGPPIETPSTNVDSANLLPPSGPPIVTPATAADAANLLPPSQPPFVTPVPPSDAADRLPPSGSPIVTPATPADAGNRLPSSLPSSSREKSQSVSRTSTIEMNMLNSLPYEIPSSILDTIATNDSRTHDVENGRSGWPTVFVHTSCECRLCGSDLSVPRPHPGQKAGEVSYLITNVIAFKPIQVLVKFCLNPNCKAMHQVFPFRPR